MTIKINIPQVQKIETCPAPISEELTRHIQAYAEAGCNALADGELCPTGFYDEKR